MEKLNLKAQNETALAALVARVMSGMSGAPLLSGLEVSAVHSRLSDAEVLLLVVPDHQMGETILNDLRFFSAGKQFDTERLLRSFFHWDMLPFDALSPAPEVSASRIHTLDCLMREAKSERVQPQVVISTVRALMQRIISPSFLLNAELELSVGDAIDRDTFIRKLDEIGYVRNTLVEEVGQLAVRGAVVDFFAPGQSRPIRVELFGDNVESLRLFDPATQRTSENISSCRILPVREFFVAPADDRLQQMKQSLRERASHLEISQRTVEAMGEAIESGTNWPGLEHLVPLFSDKQTTLWDYLPPRTAVVLCDETAVTSAADDFEELVQERAKKAFSEGRMYPEPELAYRTADWFREKVADLPTVAVDSLSLIAAATLQREVSGAQETVKPTSIDVLPNDRLREALRLSKQNEKPLQPLADEIKNRRDSQMHVGILVSQPQRAERIAELLANYELTSELYPGGYHEWLADGQRKSFVSILVGQVGNGFISLGEQTVVILESEIFPEIRKRRQAATSSKSVRRFLGEVSQLKENDFIVHIDHGVGVYRGLKQVEVAGQIGDFIALEYADQAKLLLPVDAIGKVQKYVGAEGKKTVLSKLGGKHWEKAKSKVKKHVVELAGALISLYAERDIASRTSYGPLDSDDLAFADLFPFEETPDQAAAIEHVLADMGEPRPMDRLVCGDVGYGKTEVAVRAAFKAANAGRQVAVMVPTTVLAAQHLETFRERFSEQHFEIAGVSRFQSSAENKETLERLAKGHVDIIIGTHRLLSKDVVFKNMGLLVIDEEHRFGVAHKERLKQYRKDIDVLTLTATPIPRTLHMSMVGIRDLSVIETPPCDRQVIRTYLAQYEESLVREAILREIGRSGQVFYIFNRVQGIQLVRDELADLVPEARIEFAHGQMKERELEQVMGRFLRHEIDVLVSTTIVESGLDISNANTIIIRNAHAFGLAELYQLRGRVGRSSRRAYAYLLIADPAKLGTEARKRLRVLQSLDDLGQGFRLALQDMEIRGAGNLLGKDQSGQVQLVGFELYSRILKDAVREIRLKQDVEPSSDEDRRPAVEPEMNIGFPAHIPPSYIPDVAERLLLYQRLVELRSMRDGYDLADEIQDRFGNPPQEVDQLVELMIFRSLLKRACIVTASYRDSWLRLSFHPEADFEPERILKAVAASDGKLRLSPSMVLGAKLPKKEVDSPLALYRYLYDLLGDLGVRV